MSSSDGLKELQYKIFNSYSGSCLKDSAESVHSWNWQDFWRENTGEAMFNTGRHLHNRILFVEKRRNAYLGSNITHNIHLCFKWKMPVFVPQLQQIHQTPSVKPVHCKVQHNRFSCPAKSNTFSHRGPDYHQCMNGIALGVTSVPLWRRTCGEGNCLELQWRAGCIFLSLQRQPNISLDNVNCTQNLKTLLNWKPFLSLFIREKNSLLIMKK